MKQRFTIPFGTTTIALAAGLLGCAAAQHLTAPAVVHAQTLWSSPEHNEDAGRPREIIADRFAITDSNGHVRCEIRMNNSEPEIVFYGPHGEVTWKAPPLPPHLVY